MFDYQKLIESRQPKFQDEGIRCLCCRDTGRLPDLTVKRYLVDYLPDLVAMYEHPLMAVSAPAVSCTRQGCNGGTELIDIPGNSDEDGETIKKRVPRVSYGYETLTPSLCQWVHDQEWERIQNLEPQAPVNPVRVKAAIAAGLAAVPDMPKLPDPNHSPITEEEGFRVGDRVVLGISGLDAQTQKDMRRDNDLPRLGQQCTVIRLERKAALNTERLWVTVRFDDGEEIPVLPSYLAHVREVAA